ncbi:MAG: hypothetical protein K8S27_02055 [Candidatus Omnitrophica bacterium]|nr:hypothetical protein [Candidatus Omnitrophota bacterium]
MKEDEILKGLIPWTIDEFKDVNAHLYHLLQRPKDDWDFADINLPIDVYEPIGQIAQYMKKKYDDDSFFKAHFIRYNNILRFLREYKGKLIHSGFLEDGAIPLIKDQLLKCLCVMPFSELRLTDEGFMDYCFDLNEVILKTKEMM